MSGYVGLRASSVTAENSNITIMNSTSIQSTTNTTVMNIGTSLTGATAMNIGPSQTDRANILINGVISLNNTANNSVTIGNTSGGLTDIKSNTVNIVTDSPINNTKQITIGNTTGAFDTNTLLSGKTTISKPTISSALTPAYAYPITTEGTIGYELAWTGATTKTINGGQLYGLANLSLTKGVWLLQGFTAGCNGAGYNFIGFHTSVSFGDYGTNFSSCLNASYTGFFTVNNTTLYYMLFQSALGANLVDIRMKAVKIA